MGDWRGTIERAAAAAAEAGPFVASSLLAAAAGGAAGAGGFTPLLLAGASAGSLVLGLCRHARAVAALRDLSGLAPSSKLGEAIDALGERIASFEHRAQHRHPITGLPTREHLFDAIGQSIAQHAPGLLGVIRFVDFDRIAAFDEAGAGEAIASLASRIVDSVNPAHVVAHVDRDCFAIWFGAALPEQAIAEFRVLLVLMQQEVESRDGLITPTIEAGTACCPDEGDQPQALLTRALAALARSTADASAQPGLASPSRDEARERFVLEQDLAQAIDENQLTMLFQPVVDLSRWKVVGAEALLRWDHPRLGSIPPSRFIPIVEAIGLSDRYGAWVLNSAAREARRWRDAGAGDLRIAANLSACQLSDPALKLKIARTLERHKLPPQALELELTETAAMADAARTLQLFGELHAMGISLAIDDFGSGYSSLSYLKNLPFDKLKIDREFVRHVDRRRDSQAICRALIALAGGLGLRVLAEGVENHAEVQALRRMGCNLFQGYHFARPLRSHEFLAFVRSYGPARPVQDQFKRLKGRLSA